MPTSFLNRRCDSKILNASVASLLALAACHSGARAADGTWILNNTPTAPATNNWSDPVNWFNGVIANAIDGTAFFVYNPGTLGGDNGANITLDTDRTIGRIFFEDVDGINSSSIAIGPLTGGTPTLTLQTTTGTPSINAGLLLNNAFSGKKSILNAGITLAGTQGFDKTGLGFFSLRNTNTFTGTIGILGGTLDTRVVLNNDVRVSGAGNLNLDFASSTPTADLINPSRSVTLGGATGSGYITNGSRASTNHTQTFAGLTVNPGSNAITATATTAAFTTVYTLGTITRNASGALNLATGGAGTSTFNFTPGGSVADNDASGIVGGWATFNANDWARVNGTALSAAGVTYTNNTWGTNLNTTVNGANFPALPGVNTQNAATTHTLRFQDASARVLTLTGTNTIETGGVLFGNNTNSMHQLLGGAITPGTGVHELTVHSFSAAGGWGVILNSDVVDNGAPVQLVKAGTGNLVIDGNKSFTGGTILGQGTMVLGKALGGATTGAVSGNIVNSGVLAFNRSGTFTPTNTITGNGIVAQWSDGILVLNKAVSAGGLDLRNGVTRLDFAATGAPANNIVPAGTLTTNGLWTDGGRLTLRDAGLTMNGGAGASNTQYFALTDFQGSTTITVAAGGGGSTALHVGAYNRPNNNNDGAGTLKLSVNTGATFNTMPSFPGAASSLVADNGQAFVTVNGADWGAKNASNTQVVAGSTIPGFYSDLSTLTANSNADYNADTTVSAATTLGSLRFNTVTTPATVTVNSGIQLKLGGVLVTPAAAGATNIGGTGTISAANAGGRDLVIFQNSASPLNISAIIANNSTTAADTTNIVKDGPGELNLSGANTTTGKVFVQGGLLRVSGGNLGSATAALGNIFIREGEMRVENSAVVNTGGNFISIGQRLGESGTLTLRNNATWTTAADFNVSDVNSAGVLVVQENATLNANNFYVGKGGSSVGVVNFLGGTINLTTGTNDVRIGGNAAGDSIAQGSINQSGGTMNVSRNFQLGANGIGTYNQTGGDFVTTGGFTGIGRFISGQGTWNISGGTMNVSAAGAGAQLIVGEQGVGALNVSGTGTVLAKNLTLALNGGVGTVNQTGGTVTVNATGPVTIGSVTQAGVILAPQVATSTATYSLSGGTLSTQAISRGAGSGTFNFNGGTLTPIAANQNFMADLTAANVLAGGAKIDTGGFDISIAQPLGHDLSLGVANDGGLTKSGAGVLTLSNATASTYSGPTSVSGGTLLVGGTLSGTSSLNVSGGIFQLGAADRVNDAASVTLSGGTLSSAGFGETLGAFTLAGTATLDLGSGASVFRLANSSANAWTGTLSITNWSGLSTGGGADQLFFGSTGAGLSNAQLAQVTFVNPDGFAPGSYAAKILPNGEIVAVPEPGAFVSMFAGASLLLGMRRRRSTFRS